MGLRALGVWDFVLGFRVLVKEPAFLDCIRVCRKNLGMVLKLLHLGKHY